MQIKREKLLNELRTVEAGVSKKENVEQSTCFVFQNSEVMTYNDEVACRTACSLDITGAVNAAKLIDMLTKWPEDTIELHMTKGRLHFKGKAKAGYFKIESTIRLPVKNIETPTEKSCVKLPKDFKEAVQHVIGCAKRSGDTRMNCVHFTPEYIEASDGTQAGRYEIKTPFEENVLLKNEAVRQVINITNVNTISITKNWVHFRGDNNLILSCKKYLDSYPTDTIGKLITTKGSSITLPKGLKELVERLKVFIDDVTDLEQWVKVELSPDRMKVTGEGDYGKQIEVKKVKYKGKPIGFSINPQVLKDLSNEHDSCVLTDKVIKINKGNLKFVSALYNVKETEKE